MKITKLFKFKPTKSKIIKIHHLDDLILTEFKLTEDTRIHHTGKAYKEIHNQVVKFNPWLGVQQAPEELSDDIEYNKIYYKKLADKDKVVAEGTMKFDTAEKLDDFIKNPEKYEKYEADIDIWHPIVETKVKKNKPSFIKTFINKLRKK